MSGPPTMTLADALDVVVARTGHARFRQLCDPAHPDYQPGMAAVVVATAAGRAVPEPSPTPGPPPPRFTRARRAQLTTCLYRENCGCARPKCWAKGVDVDLTECEGCMPR